MQLSCKWKTNVNVVSKIIKWRGMIILSSGLGVESGHYRESLQFESKNDESKWTTLKKKVCHIKGQHCNSIKMSSSFFEHEIKWNIVVRAWCVIMLQQKRRNVKLTGKYS